MRRRVLRGGALFVFASAQTSAPAPAGTDTASGVVTELTGEMTGDSIQVTKIEMLKKT